MIKHRFLTFWILVIFIPDYVSSYDSDTVQVLNVDYKLDFAAIAANIKNLQNISFNYDARLTRGESNHIIFRTNGYFHINLQVNKSYCSFYEDNDQTSEGKPSERQFLHTVDGEFSANHNYSEVHELYIMANNAKHSTLSDIVSSSDFANLMGYCILTDFNYENTIFSAFPLTDAFNLMQIEKIDDDTNKNFNCIKVTFKKDHFQYFITFDPSKNYAWTTIIRIHEDFTKKGKYIQNYYEASDFVIVENIYLPTKVKTGYFCGQLNAQRTDLIAKKQVDSIEYQISNYKINDNTDNFIIKNVPNGTPVFVENAPQIEYIWMDGKIVPKTDERMLAIARGGHKFMPGPKESRFWLILLGIVGILVGGGWKLYDFWTSDREPTSPQPKDQAV